MNTYLEISNTNKLDIDNKLIAEFESLLAKDKRVISFENLNKQQENGAFLFNINADLGKDELLEGVQGLGAIASLLHCPLWKCKENEIASKKNSEAFSAQLQEQHKQRLENAEKLINKHESTLFYVLRAISVLNNSRRFEETVQMNRAFDVVLENQNKGTGSWFVFFDL